MNLKSEKSAGSPRPMATVLKSLYLVSLLAATSVTGTAQLPGAFTATTQVAIQPGADSASAINLQSLAGTSVLSVDTMNARVGIGTTSPSNRLVVGSDATGPTISPSSSISVGNASATSVLTMGQDTINRMFLGWNYNLTPSSAYVSLGSLGTQLLSVQPNGGNTSFGGGMILKYLSAATSYPLSSTDYLVAFTTAGTTATLPTGTSVPVGQVYIIKNESGGSITISPAVDGGTATVPSKAVLRVYWNSSAWFSW